MGRCEDVGMVVHGKSAAQVASEARKAWIALGLTPVVMFVLIAGGDAIFSALGYADQSMLTGLPRILVSVLTAPIALAAPILAGRWGHHAFSAGNKSAAIPGIVGILVAVVLGTGFLGAALGLA